MYSASIPNQPQCGRFHLNTIDLWFPVKSDDGSDGNVFLQFSEGERVRSLRFEMQMVCTIFTYTDPWD